MVPISDASKQIYGTTVRAHMGMLSKLYMHDYGLMEEELASPGIPGSLVGPGAE